MNCESLIAYSKLIMVHSVHSVQAFHEVRAVRVRHSSKVLPARAWKMSESIRAKLSDLLCKQGAVSFVSANAVFGGIGRSCVEGNCSFHF